MEKLLMVSADSHAGIAPGRLAEYVDPQYRDRLGEQVAFNEEVQERYFGHAPDGTPKEVYDPRHVVEKGISEGLWDPAVHLAEMEAEGFVAAILYPGGPHSLGPFFTNFTFPFGPEYRAAGCRAYNRHLAEFCAHAPGRLLGVAQTETWPDMDAEVSAIRWAKENGLHAIALPRFPGLEPNQPELTDRAWDKVFAACVDLDMAVAVHVGHSSKQGAEIEAFRTANQRVTGHGMRGVEEIRFNPGRRPLWQLMFSGVFDRLPRLRVSFSEQRVAWIAPTLNQLEKVFDATDWDRLGIAMPKLRPWDYWRRHCMVGEQLRPYEVGLRHDVGIGQISFGTDFPHSEGSWPNTREWLRLGMSEVPEDELRLILGENVVRFYDLDRELLAGHAARVGLEVADIHSTEPVQRELIEILDWRSAFLSEPHDYPAEAAQKVIVADLERGAATPATA